MLLHWAPPEGAESPLVWCAADLFAVCNGVTCVALMGGDGFNLPCASAHMVAATQKPKNTKRIRYNSASAQPCNGGL